MSIKLMDCDESDMDLWAHSPCADSFFGEVAELRDKAMRDVISVKCKNRDECASEARAWNKVLALFEEALNMK